MLDRTMRDLSDYRFVKAKDLIAQAESLHQMGKNDGSINRSYFAIFNAVRSLLALLSLDSSKHRGVISFFDRYFVKTGIFGKRTSQIVHNAFDARQDSDYEDFFQPSEKEAIYQLDNAKAFIAEVGTKRNELITGVIPLPTV